MNPPNSGQIRIGGKRLAPHEPRRHPSWIGYVSEDRLSLGLVMPQSIADNIVVSVLTEVTDALGFNHS